ncbi:uncharacterized protein C8orf48-like [Antechinus flavipes]|uniref:uncharacterized protein C8orf48-like n=1 Tax=Antechinus flavipes TaxID=38775 RepID=UPI002235D0AA|nr:uncharacterized protein C8orf48-like [Antechinus flavipes]
MPYVVPGGASPEMPRDDSQQSQAEDSSVPSNYSSESFESFTEKEGEEEMVVGEEEKCHPTQRKPCGSLVASDDDQTESSASGSHSVSKWLMPSSKDEDEPLDPLDSAALQEKLSQRWIQHLKAKESANGQPRAGPTSHADVTEAPKSERDAVQAFCATKINLLRRQLNSGRRTAAAVRGSRRDWSRRSQ